MTRVVVLLVLLFPVTASSQDLPSEIQTQEARALYEQGTEAYDAESWAMCAFYFERSFTIVFAPELLYNIGRCYDRAAHVDPRREFFERAIAAYRRFERERPDAEGLEDVRARVRILREALGRLHVNEFELEVVPEPEVSVEVLGVPDLPLATDEFSWTWTVASGASAGATLLAAIVVGIVATMDYDDLVSRCGAAPADCTTGDIERIESLSTTTNSLLGVSSAFVVGAGVSFAVEFTDQESVARVDVSGRF